MRIIQWWDALLRFQARQVAREGDSSYFNLFLASMLLLIAAPGQPAENSEGTATGSADEEVSVWLFQANPNRYDILNALSDAEIGNSIHWLVNQHKKRIRKGHLGLIWMSGTEAGIYALTRIESEPAMMQEFPAEKKYWSDTTEKQQALRVRMTVIRRLTNKPILKTALTEIPGLQGLSILRQFQGTNFPVRNREWRIIAQRL